MITVAVLFGLGLFFHLLANSFNTDAFAALPYFITSWILFLIGIGVFIGQKF